MSEGFTERIGRAQREPEKPEHSREDLTLRAIIADARHSDRFGAFLAKKGSGTDHDFLEMLRSGNLDKDDMNALEIFRVEYAEKVVASEKIAQRITPDIVRRMALIDDSGMDRVVNGIGADKTVQLVREHILDVAITDEARFDDIKNKLGSLDEYDRQNADRVKKYEDETRELLLQYGINDIEFEEAARIPDSVKRRQAFRTLAERHMGTLDKWFSGGSTVAADLEGHRSWAETYVRGIDDRIKEIGDALSGVVSDNEEVRRAFSEILLEGKTEKYDPDKGSIKDAMEVQKMLQGEDEAKRVMGEAWEEYKGKQNISDWNTISATGPGSQKEHQDIFMSGYKKKLNKGKKGFWATLINFMLDEFDNKYGDDVLTF